MTEPTYIPPEARPHIIAAINQLRTDPNSVLERVFSPDSLIFTTQTDATTRLPYGTWIDPRTGAAAVIRLIAPLGYSMTSYMDINATAGMNVNDNRVQTSKWRFLLRLALATNLPPETIILLRNQARFFTELERLHEGDPPFDEIECGLNHPVPRNYVLHHFVKTASQGSSTVDMTVVSESAWKRNRPTEREDLEAAMAKDELLCQESLAQENAAGSTTSGRVVEDHGNEPDDGHDEEQETLVTWPDPLSLFTGNYWTTALKSQFILNKGIEAFDHNMEWVHPSGYKDVFREMVWVVADVTLKLWEIPPTRNTRSGVPRQGSRTYQLGLEQVWAIHQPLGDVSAKIGKRKTVEDEVLDPDAVRPPVRRPFRLLRDDSTGNAVVERNELIPDKDPSQVSENVGSGSGTSTSIGIPSGSGTSTPSVLLPQSDAMDIEDMYDVGPSDAPYIEVSDQTPEEDALTQWSDSNEADGTPYIDDSATRKSNRAKKGKAPIRS